MSSPGLSLQERIQRTRRHRRGPSPVTTTTSSSSPEEMRTSSPKVQVQKEQLTRGGSYRETTDTLSTASSSVLSAEYQIETPRFSPPRKVESLAQRRERILRRKAAQQKSDEGKGDDDVAKQSPEAETLSQRDSVPETNPRKTPETTRKIQARWPPPPALKTFLDDHEQQASSRSFKTISSGKRESQSEKQHEKDMLPSSSNKKPAELRAPFFRTSPVPSITSPAVEKYPRVRPGVNKEAPVETSESPVASPTSPAGKPSWVRPVANKEAPEESKSPVAWPTSPAGKPSWVRPIANKEAPVETTKSPVASPTSPAVRPSWVRPIANKEAPVEATVSPVVSPTSPAVKPSWVRPIANKEASAEATEPVWLSSSLMASTASPAVTKKKPSLVRPAANKEAESPPETIEPAHASSSKNASWARPSARGLGPSPVPTPTGATSSTLNAAENPKKFSWTRPTARASSSAPTTTVATSPTPNAADVSSSKQAPWTRPTARAPSPDPTTTVATSPTPNAADASSPKQAPWTRPTVRAPSPDPTATVATSPTPNAADASSPKPAPWARPTARAPSPAPSATVATPPTPNAADAVSSKQAPWERPTARASSPAPTTAAATSEVPKTVDVTSPKKASWSRPTARAPSPAPTTATTTSEAPNTEDVTSAKKTFWSRPTALAPSPAPTTATTTSEAPNTEDVTSAKKTFWSRPTARSPSPAPTTATTTSEAPNTEDVTSAKKGFWSRPTSRAPSPAPTTDSTTPQAPNTECAASPRNSAEARPTARDPSPPTTAVSAASSDEVSVLADENSLDGEDSDDDDAELERMRNAVVKAEIADYEDLDFKQMRKAGVKVDRSAELENMIDQGDWSAVVAAASRLSKLEDDDSDSSESQSDSQPGGSRGWLGFSSLLDKKPAMADQSTQKVSTDVDANDAADEISLQKSLSSRHVVTERMPSPLPNTAVDTNDAADELSLQKSLSSRPVVTERMPSPLPNTAVDTNDAADEISLRKSRSSRPVVTERMPSPLPNTAVDTNDAADEISLQKSRSSRAVVTERMPSPPTPTPTTTAVATSQPTPPLARKSESEWRPPPTLSTTEISLQKTLTTRPVVSERMPSPPPNGADATSQQTPPLARTPESEQLPSPASSTSNALNQQRVPPHPSGAGRPSSPAANTVGTAINRKAPWARHVASVGTVTAMSPDRSSNGDETKDPPWAENTTREPLDWPIDDETTPNANGKAISDIVSTPANGSNQKQSAMSRSYRKPPPSPQVGSKYVLPWARSTASQPDADAPAEKESKWSRSTAPSQPDPSAKQGIRSPAWTQSDNKQATQSPPLSPSRKILDEVKTRQKPEKLAVTAQNLAELESSYDGANLIHSYGGAVIETPKSASVANLSTLFSSGGSAPKPRSRSTPRTRTSPQQSRMDQPASSERSEHEEASPPSKHLSSKQLTSSADSDRGQSSRPPWSKGDTLNGQASSVRSAQPSWKKSGTSNGQSSLMSSPQPSWPRRGTSFQGQSVPVQNSQPSWTKRSTSHGQANQLTSPPPSWVNRDMSHRELSSMRSLQPTSTKSAPSHDHLNAEWSWINRSTSQEEFHPSKSPQLYTSKSARYQAQSSSFRSAPPSWVNRDIPQGEISPINSPPTRTAPSRGRSPPPSWVEQDISKGDLSPIKDPSPVSARTDPSNTESQSFENGKSASASPLSRTSDDSWGMQQRTAEDESQWEEQDGQGEDASVSGSYTEDDISGESRPSKEQSSSLSRHDFNPSEDNTPPASDQPKRFSALTKSLAQMAADSVYAMDYELIMAQANQEGNIEDGEVSPVSSGIGKSIPQERELPEEVKAMLDMNRSNVSSRHYDDSRAYEANVLSPEGSSSSWNSKEISALTQGSFVPRLSPSKKDIAHSFPRNTKRALNFSEEGPAPLEESRGVSARISERMSALNITVDDDDDDEMSSRIVEKLSAMNITVDDHKTDASDVGSSAIFGDPDSFGAAGGLAEEQAPSIPERAKAIEEWSGGRAKEEPMYSPSFSNSMNSIDLGSPIDFSIQLSPDSPRRIGPRTAGISDSPPKEIGGKNSLRFGDPMTFGAAGGDYAAESAPSVLDRGHAIEEWEGGHGAHPRHSPRGKQAGSPLRNAKGAKHVLQHFSRKDVTQDLMTEASRLEYPEEWADGDPEVRMAPRKSPDDVDAQKESEEMDSLKGWHFTNVRPYDANKMDAQDPFFQQGDPFAASNSAGRAVDSNTFNPFAEETFALDDSFDFQLEKSAKFFSPYGDDTQKKEEIPKQNTGIPKKNTGIVPRTPPARASKAKLKPSRRDRMASAKIYDHYYAQQAKSNSYTVGESFEI